MRLLRFRTRGMGIKDGQGSWTPPHAQATPGNTRQREAMDVPKGGTTLRGKRSSEITSTHAKLDMLIDFYLDDLRRPGCQADPAKGEQGSDSPTPGPARPSFVGSAERHEASRGVAEHPMVGASQTWPALFSNQP